MIGLNKRRRGIALVELVIVLAIIGLVSGAIWAAASAVRANEKIQDSVQVFSDISARVRSIYTGFPGAVPPPVGNPTAQIAQNLYPESVVNAAANGTLSAWGGVYEVYFDGANAGNGFTVVVTLSPALPIGVRNKACLGIVTRLSATATSYAGGIAGIFPTGTVAREPNQGTGSSLAFVRTGAATWNHVTASGVDVITAIIQGGIGCTAAGFYYRL